MTPGKYDLGDYKEVSERIIDFRQKYPDGSLSDPEVILWPTKELPFLAVRAKAYRSKQDAHPGMGLAWEPFPGKTPYTKDSELQNAETSAWGRAIVAALASDTKHGIASADEVRARRSTPEPHSSPGDPTAQGSGHAGAGESLSSPAPAPSVEAEEVSKRPESPRDTASRSPLTKATGRVEPPASTSSGTGEANTGSSALQSTPVPESSGSEVGEGEAHASGPASPEQRTRLLAVYKKPSEAKAKAVQLFDRFEKVGDVLIADLTSSEVEKLILEAASVTA